MVDSEPASSPWRDEIARRRTFAIISHPDAGKTTLTEKLLWFGGAIQTAGAVRARKASRHAVSDWMEMERERGISVTTSVMSFEYPVPTWNLDSERAALYGTDRSRPRGGGSAGATANKAMINLLDTPGHADFGEDTYRVLTAVDSALMVIDGAKGVEERTEKLIEICRLRDTPVVTFVNKFDRECREPVDLLDEIEKHLKMSCVPMTWPIGVGKRFKGVYHLPTRSIHTFRPGRGDSEEVADGIAILGLDDPRLDELCGDEADQLRTDLELLSGAAPEWDHEAFLAGKMTPLFFGSAVNNFGVRELLEAFVLFAPTPCSRDAVVGKAVVEAAAPGDEVPHRRVDPNEPNFSGFVFKIQANMDPNHRDRIAFLRICSGRFVRGMKAHHCRLDRQVNMGNALTFLARDRELVEEAVAGDIIGLPNHGTIKIGDAFSEGELLRFSGIPSFAPELFRRVELKTPLKAKQLAKGLEQLAEEGAIQVFKPLFGSTYVVGAVGQLQLEVMKHRLLTEYTVEADYGPVDYSLARWASPITEGKTKQEIALVMEEFRRRCDQNLYTDGHGDLTYLSPNKYNLKLTEERFPGIRFTATREHT